eukprot:Skav221166  [mRNA]  locus=scaffold85:363226:369408:+ [translate_table: standard]
MLQPFYCSQFPWGGAKLRRQGRHIEKCKYVHYAPSDSGTLELNDGGLSVGVHNRGTDTKRINELVMKGINLPAQWIHCDLRTFPLSIFKGLISVVMADPPWDIHMELPYGTLTDEEVKNLNVGDIHEHGMIFLWVTGRAMELARECFKLWGYKRRPCWGRAGGVDGMSRGWWAAGDTVTPRKVLLGGDHMQS